MNILTNGCSFSRGPGSWPYKIKSSSLVNLAQAGAGNSYIHESTVYELSQRHYDYVIIMWSGIARVDFRVEEITQFDSSKFTSNYQRKRNDWPGKVIFPVNDQDYVDPTWVFGDGIINNERNLVNKNFLNGVYKYLGPKEFRYHMLQKVIALQSLLKDLRIPYLFSFYKNYTAELTDHPLFKLVDTGNAVMDSFLFDIATELNDFEEDKLHPGLTAHAEWAKIIESRLHG